MARHGMRSHPLYKTWAEMRYRCENPKKWQFKYYGAKGISVCERWQHFPSFVEDMGDRPDGCTLDRIDRLGNYEPSNCRWASRKEQANNSSWNRIIEFNGQKRTLAEWGEVTGINFATIWARINRGWDIERALTHPLMRSRFG